MSRWLVRNVRVGLGVGCWVCVCVCVVEGLIGLVSEPLCKKKKLFLAMQWEIFNIRWMVFLMCTTYVSDLIATPFEFAIVGMVVFSKLNTLEYGIKCRWFENYTTKRTQTYVYGYVIIYACFYDFVMSIYFMMIDIKLTIHENHMALEWRCSQRISSKRWRFFESFFFQ